MSNRKKTICIFCSSAANLDEVYQQAARDAAGVCAKNGWNVVYGGSRSGLMGIVADEALKLGAEVTGVIPDYLRKREIDHEGLTQLFVTDDMHERQMKMSTLADGFIILPGGLGTMAELFEVVTWRQLGIHDKPIVIYNVGGYWDDLLAMLKKASSGRFLYAEYTKLFTVVDRVGDIAENL